MPKVAHQKAQSAPNKAPWKIPYPLKAEHEELHAELVKATQLTGKVGAAAQKVATLLHPHFVSEEEFALPPLALLPALAAGHVTPDLRGVLRLTDKLKASLPQMLREHEAVVGALEDLTNAAKREGRPEIVRFAQQLKLHAQTEEQVLYPAAILVGEYVRTKLGG